MIELRKNIANIIAVATLMTGGIGVAGSVSAEEKAHPVPAPEVNEPSTQNPEIAILAGGCFWGVQGVSSARQRRYQRGLWLHRRRENRGALFDGRFGINRARGISARDLRSSNDQLWAHPSNLFLRRPRSYRTQAPGG